MVLVHEIEKQLPESDMTEVMSCIRRALADEYELEIHMVVLIKSGTIPRTSSGKIQRHACRAAFESGQLAVVGTSTLDQRSKRRTVGALSEIPQTTIEKRLADIWQEVLGGPRRVAMRTSLRSEAILCRRTDCGTNPRCVPCRTSSQCSI